MQNFKAKAVSAVDDAIHGKQIAHIADYRMENWKAAIIAANAHDAN